MKYGGSGGDANPLRLICLHYVPTVEDDLVFRIAINSLEAVPSPEAIERIMLNRNREADRGTSGRKT